MGDTTATSKPCPCGALSRPGSPYCGDDCEPTHMPALARAVSATGDPWADVFANRHDWPAGVTSIGTPNGTLLHRDP